MFKKALLLIILILFSLPSFAQKYIHLKTYNIDSLLSVLPDQLGEERVNSLNNLAVSLCYEEFDLAEQYAEEAMNLAKELNYLEGIAAAYRNLAQIRFYQDNYPDALKNDFESLRIYEKLNNKYNIAVLYGDIAELHFYAGNYEKVFEYGNIALDKFRERLEGGLRVGGMRDTLRILGGFGLVYDNIGMYDKSLEISRIYLKLGKENNFRITEMVLQTFLAGTRFVALGETDSAVAYYHKALSYPNINPDVEALKYRVFKWLGFFHYSQGSFDTAMSYLQKSYDFYQKKGFLFWAMRASNDLGYFYFENDDINVAEEYYQQSEKLFNEMLTNNSWIRHDSLLHITVYGLDLYLPIPPKHLKELMWRLGQSMYYKLYQINEINKRSDEAFIYYLAYSDAKDTLNEILRSHESMELQTKYETEIKEGQIDFLSQENAFQEFKLKQFKYFLFGMSGLVLLIVILAIVLIRQNKLRNEQKNLLLQQKLFRSQMNPHFIFNSLSNIHNYIIDEQAHKAGQYLSKFSKLVRNILNCSVEEYISLEEEVATIENYLELQKMRFQDKFDYSIEVDEAIDTESSIIPPMLLQPFVENCIEHGFKHKETRGNISICFTLKNNVMLVVVEDDGIGRQKAQEIIFKDNKDHKSIATGITLERIQVLNKKLKKKIELNILDLKTERNEPAGTKVTFKIPIIIA